MEISELQISQVNKQIEALIKAESFYGKNHKNFDTRGF